MGTDIHLSAEAAVMEDGEIVGWEFIPGPVIDCWACDGTGIKHVWQEGYGGKNVRVPTGEPCGWCTNDGSDCEDEDDRVYYANRYVEPGKTRDRWYSDRNYLVFAMLANVRNGYGFAGTPTHTPIAPICEEPRGIPDDVTDGTRAILSGEHTETWITLGEIWAHDWAQPIAQFGVVDPSQFLVFQEKGRPDSWSGGISGGQVVSVTNERMAELVESGQIDWSSGEAGLFGHPRGMDGNLYITRVEWITTTEESCSAFLERMKLLSDAVGERPTRLVMDFDS